MFFCAAALAGCGGLSGEQASPNSLGGQPQSGFVRFTDVPMPIGNKVDLDRTMVFGVDRDWIGRITMSSSLSVAEAYDFYKREMIRLGWSELTSVRSSISVLIYQMDSRIANVQITSSRGLLGGSQIELSMNPRAAPGASGAGGASSFGGSGAPIAAPRGGAVDSGPLSPIRR